MISLGLIGYPLFGSLSPRLHAAALLALGLSGEYQLYPIPPLPEGEPALRALLARLRAGELYGLNVTVPHKQAVLPYLDELTPLAQHIGAVNTIYARRGRLVGDNTDAPGFLSDLRRVMAPAPPLTPFPPLPEGERGQSRTPFALPGETGQSPMSAAFPGEGERHPSPPSPPLPGGERGPGGEGQTALVLGAGGAGRAAAFVLALAGWQVRIAARRLVQADALAADLRAALDVRVAGRVTVTTLDHAGLAGQAAHLLVNATPVGMIPRPDACPWPEDLPLPPEAFVYDLIYKPPETILLRRARQAGLPAINGLGMLVEQAALALETWIGRPVPRPALWQAAIG